MNMNHRYPYRWTLADAVFTKDKGRVFSCFACGGGSTMGYKLAGYDVIGDNEIDERMNRVYVANHSPRYNYLCDIRELVAKAESGELPEDLYHLDVLDGSPPCSSFSTAGTRDDDWGKEKHFREGQVAQVLDTLFFDFIALAKVLRPKVVVAENVKGLMMGAAWPYMRRIYAELEEAGYIPQHWLLNGADMGIPQSRERVFFCCLRKDLAGPFLQRRSLFDELPAIDMEFNEPPIPCSEFLDYKGREIAGGKLRLLWDNRKEGDWSQAQANERLDGKRSNFGQAYIYPDKPSPTLTAKEGNLILFEKPVYASSGEVCCISSFPSDYNFLGERPWYICGMSVPPVMMAQVSTRVYDCWLSKI